MNSAAFALPPLPLSVVLPAMPPPANMAPPNSHHMQSSGQAAGGLHSRGPARRRGEVAADGIEILGLSRCRDADRQFSVGSAGPPGRRLAARRRRTRPGAIVIRQHSARLGLHGARVKHAAFSDVADTGVKRLGDMSWCGAAALLVHRSNPNKTFVWPATLRRPGLGFIVGVLRCHRDSRSQRHAFACVTRIPPLAQPRPAWHRVPSRGQCGTRQ